MSSGALSGVTTITGSGLATVGSLDVDDVLVDGATIGHTDDTDLVTLSNGTVTVAGTLAATTLTGDGSGITGVSANSIKSDDITEGDAAVTISTSTGAINLTPATGSAVVLDGSVNVDGGAVTGATTITASGAITGGSVTDGTATMSSGALSGVTTITGSGLATVGSLDVDDVLVDGATIGHTDDTDLVTLSNGTVTVAGTLAATTLTGDGSGITGVSANSIKSDDITEGDAAVTISTSTGAINLTPATGSAVVLDGSVNVDGGAVTGATTITASGAITGGSVTDGTATMSSGALSGVTTITGSGLATVGSLDVDDVLVDGATIGHTDDTDLVTLSNGTVTVAGTLAATTLTGDGSGITGVSANSIKSDDITEGDAAVTISTSTGAINLTPATGSAVVLDGSVNVDGGAVTGATTITASGAITGGSVTDGTATMSSGALSGVTTITGSGLATVGSLDVDDVLVDGATIGHTDDTDLVTLSNGTVTVAGTLAATTLTGDGSGITGVSASSLKSDDITEGDAAVTISTSTGAINLTPATGSAVVLDGSVNVDGGAVTGATTITASGAITGGSVTDGTATMSSGALSGVTTITGSGLATVGSLDVDDVLVDGATIGHTDDTDLVTLSNGTVTVAGTLAATTLTGDGSGITGVSANSIKSDDITEGDAAVTISTSTGAINLTPATGSAVVLDGSVNVDGGAVTGATTITASGAITGGSVTDGTATMSSGALSGVTTITGSGLATVGSLDVDDVLVDGATIGHTDDTDLVTLSNGTVTVAGTLAATTLTGDGSGITGVSANSIKSDDITEGDAAVTISTSTGAINLTPATGSAVVLDGSVNVDGGAVTGATTITASGAITGGSVTDGTATMSSGALSGVTTITGSGLATVGSLDVDDVLVDGATIGHTDDTDLVTLSNGTVTVAGTLAATTLTGDGSGITGVSANSIKSDDITEGDAAVTISTSTGAINLTPATGSAVVLDGSVNVDGGAVTGATTITASGAITGGSVTDGTATMSSGALSGVTTITGSGLATVGSLDVDDVLVDGATIGHTDDTDLVTLSNGTVTVAGEITATTLDIGGTNITATATEINVLDGALKENNSIWIGNDPSSTTNNALRNIGLGVTALDAITTGDNNVAIGYDALTENTTGSENMGVGYNALKVNVGGSGNSAIGSGSLASNTGGDFNTAVGSNSLNENIGGDKNVAIGNSSLRDNTSGNNNTSIGKSSSQLITTGDDNVALGYQAGNVLTTGNKNVIIGSDSDPSALDGTNQIVIGYGTTGKGNNTVTIGDGDITNWTPTDDGEVDLGSSSVEFKDIYIDGVAYTDAIGFGSTAMTLPSADGTSGQVLVTDGSGVLSWSSNAGSANRATTVTITDNEDTNENNALVFTSGGDVDGGNLGLESDGTATYNPSTGIITATGFNGNLTGTLQTAAQTNITSVGTLSSLTVSGAVHGW